MFVTYKVTNLVTKQYYIGSHKTNDVNDNYMGSGRMIRKSIEQYGIENHCKEIIGVFETRKESLLLEHSLVKAKKKDDLILNLSFGGESFDYINENLKFDRASFGQKGGLASAKTAKTKAEAKRIEYEKFPNKCRRCGKVISWEKRHNIYCSISCSAAVNNTLYPKRKPEGKCKMCGQPSTTNKTFCSQSCRAKYFSINNSKAKSYTVLLEHKEEVLNKYQQGVSLKKLRKEYNVSNACLKEFIAKETEKHTY